MRAEQILELYKEIDEETIKILEKNNDRDMHIMVALTNISQSLKNIDITLALILDDMLERRGIKW